MPTRTMASSRRAGFTLLELMVVVAIIAIAAGLGIPSFLSARREKQLDNRTRELKAMIARAQSEAATGRELTGAVAGVTGRVRMAGIRFVDRFNYFVFVDNDDDPVAVEVVARVDLEGEESGGGLSGADSGGTGVRFQTVTANGLTQFPPSGIEFRFLSDGTIAGSGNVSMVLGDTELRRRNTIDLSVAGQVSVTPGRY